MDVPHSSPEPGATGATPTQARLHLPSSHCSKDWCSSQGTYISISVNDNWHCYHYDEMQNFLALYKLICVDSPSPDEIHTKVRGPNNIITAIISYIFLGKTVVRGVPAAWTQREAGRVSNNFDNMGTF